MQLPGTSFSSWPPFKLQRAASSFWLVCNPEYNVSASMMGRRLLLGCDRFTQRQNLRHDWFDLSGVDQLGDLSQIFRIGMNRDTRAANAALLDFSRVGARDERHDDAAFLHHTVGTCQDRKSTRLNSSHLG